MPLSLDTSVAALHRVGKTLEQRLRKLGIATVRDVLFHVPFRYEDYRVIRRIADLRDGEMVTICATIELIANKRSHRKRVMVTEAVVADDSGRLRIVWFGQPFIGHTLASGDRVFFSGTVKQDAFGLTLASPGYEKERRGEDTLHTARLLPIYPLTAGITQKQFRFLVAQALAAADALLEWIPEEVRRTASIVPLPQAIRFLHAPKDASEQQAAQRRLKFGELFLLQLKAEMLRRERMKTVAPMIAFPESEVRAFVARLPYALTKDQKIAAWEILQDIGRSVPMNRLLQGDVGCGKTVVAGLAAYAAAVRDSRTVLMAPTEILAFQHYETLQQLFRATEVSVGLRTRSRREGDDATIVVGTHALLSRDAFDRVGLVVVDEQHRFGVLQRKLLKEKTGDGEAPHFLSMTATPIPRSLALIIYGDLDVSVIRILPPGRQTVATRVVAPHEREQAYMAIRAEVEKGRQAFVVCPLIQTSDFSNQTSALGEKKTVLNEYKKLSEKIFPDLRVGYVHGKMSSKEKTAAMCAFAAGETDILVATSVVEVGVNIPNATIMMIEGAERFGLAQLHQFRGRVGRSAHASACFLFADDASSAARERLAFFQKTTDGFALAEYDLLTRGPGEVYGKEQSGMMQLRLATTQDTTLLRLAKDIASSIVIEDFPTLRENVEAGETVHLE